MTHFCKNNCSIIIVLKHFDLCNLQHLFQNKINRLPAYLTVQFVRFYFKEKEAINAKILKVSDINTYKYWNGSLEDLLFAVRCVIMIRHAVTIRFAVSLFSTIPLPKSKISSFCIFSHLWLYSLVCVRPGLKPGIQVFS